MTLVVAPAGYGKTTSLAAFAASSPYPVAWCRLETWDGAVAALQRHLRAALRGATGDAGSEWRSVEDAAGDMERSDPLLLVLDDVHTIEGTAGEGWLGQLIECAPSAISIVVSGRTPLRLNLSRLRVSGELLELGVDALRFRTWEVERLFRDLYDQPLSPEELAELSRRTEGWAAGLQLFHLATQQRSGEERRQVLAGLASHSRLVRDYLTRNLLDQLPVELRDFLVATSLLGRLSGPLCDRYLGRRGSHSVLEELERRRLLTQSVDGESSFRCHEVLRSHLEQTLVEELGDEAVRQACRRAGVILEEAGHLPEALRAHSRAEDGDAVKRLLERQGARLAEQPGGWMDRLPAALLGNDPWLLLATGRRHAAQGRLRDALDSYHRAERGFAGSAVSEICREERLVLAAWIDPASVRLRDGHWSGPLRAALTAEPLRVAAASASSEREQDALMASLCCLIAGRVVDSAHHARAARAVPDLGPVANAVSRAAQGLSRLMVGDASGLVELEASAEVAEREGLGWVARLAHAAKALSGDGEAIGEAGTVRLRCTAEGDPWGATLAALLQGWGGVISGQCPSAILQLAAVELRRLGARSLEAWALALGALSRARAGDPEAAEVALQAERLARHVGVSAARIPACLAVAVAKPSHAAEMMRIAEDVAAECGLKVSVWSPSAPSGDQPERELLGEEPAPSPIEIRCFGGLGVLRGGVPVELGAVKPRARSLLRLLAAHAGDPVHREVIIEALWPDIDPVAGLRSLQVAVSSIRGLLDPAVSAAASLIVRDGDAYRLSICPPQLGCDTHLVRELLARARSAGEPGAAALSLTSAVELIARGLLPEEGPAPWVEALRERCIAQASDAAVSVSEAAMAARLPAAVAEACAAGLRLDAYNDHLWRLLITAEEGSGNLAAAARSRGRYEKVLGELGVRD
ncbi:MAG: winged helix-turn-helix domain-containing protein [Candidatus Dormiibacterota bacterium]